VFLNKSAEKIPKKSAEKYIKSAEKYLKCAEKNT
jgi:hypothetical protein